MLRGLRKASSNWLGKVVMGTVVGVLVISFAIWGVGDMFRGFGRSTVASVGSTEIGIEQFRQVYNERIQRIAAQIGRPIPADQARALGLDRQILGQVISDAALDERARQLKLGITDEEVARQIRQIPAFKGANGEFDPAFFEVRIRQAGYTEPRFVAEQRRLMVRQHLTESISNVATPPSALVNALNQYQNESRNVEYVVLDRGQAGDIPDPTPEQIAGFFESRKNLFRAPEYRRITVLKLASADVAKWTTVTDEDARQAYDQRRSRYVTPGRRQVQQIIFPNPEEAQAAKARIDSGTPFEKIAEERGLKESDIDLGLVARNALAAAVAEAAFTAPEGGVGGPVQARLGTALVRVVKIEPDRVKTFEEAKPEIMAEIVRDRTRAEINEKHDRIEDERAGGQNLTEAAQKLGLVATTIDAVDRSGRDPGGAQVTTLPTEVDILPGVFSTDVGIEADPLKLPDNGYVWFEVNGITPAKDRSLEEVKSQVEERWREQQIAERLQAKAAVLVDKLKAGTPLQDVAAAEKVKVEATAGVLRNVANAALSAPTVAAVFTMPKGGVGTAEGRTLGERVVFRVTDITVPKIDDGNVAGKRLEDTLRTAIGDDLLRQYVAQVERDLGTSINADALRRVTGGESF